MALLGQALTVQANRGEVDPANLIGRMGATRVWEFLRMNPPVFYGSKVGEDPNGFIEEVYKLLPIIEVSSIEKVELASFQLKDVAQIWYAQWQYSRSKGVSLIEWETS